MMRQEGQMIRACKIISLIAVVLLFFAYSQESFAKNENKPEKQEKVKPVVGNVKEVSAGSLIVEEKIGKEKHEAQVDATTKVVGQDKKIMRIRDIKPNDKVAIISTDSATVGKKGKVVKIFVKPASTAASASGQMKRRSVQGVVANISGTTITLIHQIQQSRTYTVETDSATVIRLKGTQAATLASIMLGQRIVAIGDVSTTGGILAKRIHVIPGLAKGVLKRISITPSVGTPSAALSPTITGIVTPIASPTSSVTPTGALSPTATQTPTITPTP
jgi:hypothetical protein